MTEVRTPFGRESSPPLPWTDEQVAALNRYQTSGRFHPFTCGNKRTDEAHFEYRRQHGGDLGQLVATRNGWVCPVPGCGYTQDWAHAAMFDETIQSALAEGPR